MAEVILSEPRVVPSTGDAPILTLACCTLLASQYPHTLSPAQSEALAMETIDVVFDLWTEIMQRIAAGPAAEPASEGG